MSNEIGVIGPTNMAELERFAKTAATSGFFGAKTPEQAMMIAMSGRDLGLSYSQSLRAFHVIEGRPSMSADGMVAVCLSRPDLCQYFRTLESTIERCVVETHRVGAPAAQSHMFTMAAARAAGLASKQMWAKYPRNMLRSRAKAELARDVYPDLLMGLYDPDELAVDDRAPASRPVVIETIAVESAEPTPQDRLAEAGITVPAFDAWRRATNTPTWAQMTGESQATAAKALGSTRTNQRKAFDAWRAESRAPSVPAAADAHHPSWAADRAAFCANLGRHGLKYEDVKAYCLAMGRPKPSALTQEQRDGLAGWLGGATDGAAEIRAWADAAAGEGQ